MNAQAVIVERRYRTADHVVLPGLFSVGGLVGAGCAELVMWFGASPDQHVVVTMVVALMLVGAALPSRSRTIRWQRSEGRVRSADRAVAYARLARLRRAAGRRRNGGLDAVYLRDTLASSAAVAAIGFAACSMMMAIGRFVGDRLVGAFGAGPVLRSSGVLAAAGLGLALLRRTPAAAIVGCGMVGLGSRTRSRSCSAGRATFPVSTPGWGSRRWRRGIPGLSHRSAVHRAGGGAHHAAAGARAGRRLLRAHRRLRRGGERRHRTIWRS